MAGLKHGRFQNCTLCDGPLFPVGVETACVLNEDCVITLDRHIFVRENLIFVTIR